MLTTRQKNKNLFTTTVGLFNLRILSIPLFYLYGSALLPFHHHLLLSPQTGYFIGAQNCSSLSSRTSHHNKSSWSSVFFKLHNIDRRAQVELSFGLYTSLPLHNICPPPVAVLLIWCPTLALQMFLDFNSQKSWPAEVVVKASGSCSLGTSGGPRLDTTARP